MSHEAIVLCPRVAPTPPGGWPWRDGGIEYRLHATEEWLSESERFLEGRTTQVVVAHLLDPNPCTPFMGWCEALADATGGVVLTRVPVIAVPTYRMVYRGRGVDLEWQDIPGYVKGKQEADRRAAEEAEAKKRADWERRIEQETDKHVLLDELLSLMRRTGGEQRHIDLMLEPEWLEKVSLENLHFTIRKHRELLRLQEANEGLYERWQAHVARGDGDAD